MTMQDLNQVTISGHILSEPQLHRFDDEDAYTLTLTHHTDHHQSGHWELQLYSVSIWPPTSQAFIDQFQLGQRVTITGRLDCVCQQTLTGYQPVVSIIAERIITLQPRSQNACASAEQLLLRTDR
jgi:single-stranded DNA-binding protein